VPDGDALAVGVEVAVRVPVGWGVRVLVDVTDAVGDGVRVVVGVGVRAASPVRGPRSECWLPNVVAAAQSMAI
jgi:hypothetical protein